MIKVYTSESCPWCHKVKKFLKKNKIKYKEIDIGKNPEAGQEIMKKTGQVGVPVIDIDGEIIIGFDEEKLRGVLKL